MDIFSWSKIGPQKQMQDQNYKVMLLMPATNLVNIKNQAEDSSLHNHIRIVFAPSPV